MEEAAEPVVWVTPVTPWRDPTSNTFAKVGTCQQGACPGVVTVNRLKGGSRNVPGIKYRGDIPLTPFNGGKGFCGGCFFLNLLPR